MNVKTVTQIFVLNTLTRIRTILWNLCDVCALEFNMKSILIFSLSFSHYVKALCEITDRLFDVFLFLFICFHASIFAVKSGMMHKL